jgi:hypothetical protein
MVSRAMLEDRRLSFVAKGLMAFIESQPDDFEIDSGLLAGRFSGAYNGNLAVAKNIAWNAISELIEAGYLRGEQA